MLLKKICSIFSRTLAVGIGLLTLAAASLVVIRGDITTVDAIEADQVTFESIQKDGVPQEFTHQAGKFNFTVWAQTISDGNKYSPKDLIIYGKIGDPYHAADIGITKFDSSYLLPNERCYLLYNSGINATLKWEKANSGDDPQKWQVFRLDNDSVPVRGNEVELCLNGEKFTVKLDLVPERPNVDALDKANVEHINDYEAAKTAGIEMDETTIAAYEAKRGEVETMIQKVRDGEIIKQQVIDQLLQELNETFAAIMPKPFHREPLRKLAVDAKSKIDQNGKKNKRFTKATFEPFMTAYAEAVKLLNTPDLKTILVPHHADPATTHRDFKQTATNLTNAMAALQTEDYVPTDLRELKATYIAAIAKMPAAGKGFSEPGRTEFLDQIALAEDLLLGRAVYTSMAEATQMKNDLTLKMNNLAEVDLDQTKKITLKIRYLKPAKNAVSPLLQEPFKDANDNIIEDAKVFVTGSEVSLKVNELRKFDGYVPAVFHLNGDDGTLKLVRVLTDLQGNARIRFKAVNTNSTNTSDLDISYVKGQSLSMPSVKDDDKENDGTKGGAGYFGLGYYAGEKAGEIKFLPETEECLTIARDDVPSTSACSQIDRGNAEAATILSSLIGVVATICGLSDFGI